MRDWAGNKFSDEMPATMADYDIYSWIRVRRCTHTRRRKYKMSRIIDYTDDQFVGTRTRGNRRCLKKHRHFVHGSNYVGILGPNCTCKYSSYFLTVALIFAQDWIRH